MQEILVEEQFLTYEKKKLTKQLTTTITQQITKNSEKIPIKKQNLTYGLFFTETNKRRLEAKLNQLT